MIATRCWTRPDARPWETPFYGIGLKVYNALAGKCGFGPSEVLSAKRPWSGCPPSGRKASGRSRHAEPAAGYLVP
jgi:glycerol-3-phosphate dehydrogenase